MRVLVFRQLELFFIKFSPSMLLQSWKFIAIIMYKLMKCGSPVSDYCKTAALSGRLKVPKESTGRRHA